MAIRLEWKHNWENVMTTRLIPEVGSWYRDRIRGRLFQVVALDDHTGSVEVQDSDGDLDEVDQEAWFDLSLDIAAAPEDPMGPSDPRDPEEREYALAGEGWEPSLPREIGERADSIQDDSDFEEPLSELDEPLH
jgi:hypothetical protein